ncbi:9053_t:CDS:2, partial [Racocetra fulgida]
MYTNYNDLITIKSRNEPILEIPSAKWGVYDSMTEEFFLSKAFSESMQPSHVIPYYFRADNPPDEEDITITTLITSNRFPVFDRLVTNYQGPISVTIHVSDDEETREELLKSLNDLYNGNPYMKQYVDVHLVVDRFDRQFNMWRNIAKFFARTNYIMMLDYADLNEGLNHSTFPTTKKDALELVDSKRLVMFHASWKPGHAACLFELYLSGVDYWVLPEDFLIHQTHKYLENARKHE